MAMTMTPGKAIDQAPWPQWLTDELAGADRNGCVGNELVSEHDRVRVWTLRLKPGERYGFHKHVLDYFWTCMTGGRARSHHHDGSSYERDYVPGETQHERYAAGGFKIHDLENTGTADLIFTTVEFLDSANPALPIPNAARFEERRKAA